MKISELIICITIFCLITIVCLETYTSFERNYKNTEEIIYTSEHVIEFDYKLRTYIDNIYVPYWKNKKNIYEIEKEKIFNMDMNDEYKILSINPIVDNEEEIIGISVLWRYKEKEIETRERF